MRKTNLEELIADYCSGTLTDEGWSELRRSVESDPTAREQFLQAAATDKYIKTLRGAHGITAAAWSSIEQQIAQPHKSTRHTTLRRRRILLYGSSIAAAVLVLAIVTHIALDGGRHKAETTIAAGTTKAILRLADGQSFYLDSDSPEEVMRRTAPAEAGAVAMNNTPKEEMNTLVVPRGGKYRFALADGTVVWMNSASQIRFPAKFAAAEREIEVSGELFLEVAHNPEQPFIVRVGNSRIKVLGTRFNISAYPEERRVVTTLVAGSVEFASPDRTEILTPGEQTVYSTESGSLVKKKVDTSLFTSWIEGEFEFEKSTLREITRYFARWYDVTFVFENDALGDYLFTGINRRDDDLEVILNSISKTTNIQFEIKGKEIIVRSR